MFEGDAACGECGRELAERPRVERPVSAHTPEAPPEPEAEASPAPTPMCAVHGERPAPRACARCGRFACVECMPSLKHEAMCVDCVARERRAELPGQELRVRREIKVSFFFFAAVCFALGMLMPVLLTGTMTMWAIVSALSSFVMLALAIGYVFTESAVVAGLAMVLEALVGASLFWVVEGKCLSWPLLLMPVVTFFRLRKLSSLRAELPRHG